MARVTTAICGTRIPCALATGLVVALLATMVAGRATAGPPSLGTARGDVRLSLDNGKTWLPAGPSSMPVLDDSQVRTRSGGATLDLTDGSRVTVLPFSSVRVRKTAETIEVTLLSGRVTFRLPERSRVEIATAAARLEPMREGLMAGEVFVADVTTGLKMHQGRLRVRELAEPHRVLVATTEPVFIPERPAIQGPLFSSDVPAEAPAGATAAFTPAGESLGYVAPDGRLVVQPGYTADLLRPLPSKLTQAAQTAIPEQERRDATPVFDVNGRYLGFEAGSMFTPRSSGGTGSGRGVAAASASGAVTTPLAPLPHVTPPLGGTARAPLVVAGGPPGSAPPQPNPTLPPCPIPGGNPPASPNAPLPQIPGGRPCGAPF